MFKKNEVIQFNDRHKFSGVFGIIMQSEQYNNDIRYTVKIPIPNKFPKLVLVLESEQCIDYIGVSVQSESEVK